MQVITVPGPGEAFVEFETPDPEVAEDQFLVEVKACGVCGHDILNRKGAFGHARYPLVMGHEISGTIAEAGSAVRGFSVGDRVALVQRVACGRCEHCRVGHDNRCRQGPGFYGEELSGGYGEYVKATARNALHLPDAISFEEGAILSCALGTGYHALLGRSDFLRAEWVLITGATGGVGIHAVQIAAAHGKRVIAVTGSGQKAEALKSFGAEAVVISPDLDFSNEVREISGGGVDLVLEILGTKSLANSIRSVRRGGEVIVIGNITASHLDLNPALLILKEISLVGSAHGSLDDLAHVMNLVQRGTVRPIIHQTFPRAEAEEAHEMVQSRDSMGRVVLMG